MKNEKQAADLKRRRFLLAGSAGAAGAVAVTLAPGIRQTAPVAAASPVSGDAGYRDTDHVRTYYELARI